MTGCGHSLVHLRWIDWFLSLTLLILLERGTRQSEPKAMASSKQRAVDLPAAIERSQNGAVKGPALADQKSLKPCSLSPKSKQVDRNDHSVDDVYDGIEDEEDDSVEDPDRDMPAPSPTCVRSKKSDRLLTRWEKKVKADVAARANVRRQGIQDICGYCHFSRDSKKVCRFRSFLTFVRRFSSLLVSLGRSCNAGVFHADSRLQIKCQ
jgi:hypothetical protein